MANALGRDIEAGEVLVIKRTKLSSHFADVNLRLFVARSGFGMSLNTGGGSIMGDEYQFVDGRYVYDGRSKWDGSDFSRSETKAWQAEHGKFLPTENALADQG